MCDVQYMLPKLNTAMVFSESLAQPNQNVVLDTTKVSVDKATNEYRDSLNELTYQLAASPGH